MAPRDLLQDTVEYNRKVNLTWKMLKSKKHPLPTLPLMLVGPVQPGVPANVPVKSGKVIRRHVATSEDSNRPVQPGVPANVPVESGKVIRRRVALSKAINRL